MRKIKAWLRKRIIALCHWVLKKLGDDEPRTINAWPQYKPAHYQVVSFAARQHISHDILFSRFAASLSPETITNILRKRIVPELLDELAKNADRFVTIQFTDDFKIGALVVEARMSVLAEEGP